MGEEGEKGVTFSSRRRTCPKPLFCPLSPSSPNRNLCERKVYMRCLYREKRHKCGKYLEVDVFPVLEYQHGRSKKRKPTSEVQKNLNRINAEKKLARLLSTNFTSRDIRFDLTYNPDNLPASPEDAQRQMQNFLRRVKRFRKRMGLSELKYVAVTEVGKNNGRVHHHIIMSGGVSISDLAELWGRGYTTAKPLQFNETGLVGMAYYFVIMKEPVLGKRWCSSKNLEKPKESQRDGVISKRKVKEICENMGEDNGLFEKLYPGYLLSEINTYYNGVNGGYYVTVIMREKPVKSGRKAG